MDGAKACVITYPSPFTPHTPINPHDPYGGPWDIPTTGPLPTYVPYAQPNSIDASKLLESFSNSAFISKSELTKIAKSIVDYVTSHPEAAPILAAASKLLELAK